jgi:hypothetical protein
MPSQNDYFTIERQRQAVQSKDFYVELVLPCSIDHGILKLPKEASEKYRKVFIDHPTALTFFIPASGLGSRMFERAFTFLNDPSEKDKEWVENWMDSLPEMAIYQVFPSFIQEALINKTIALVDFVHWFIHNSHLRIQNLPKGLIPFHSYSDGVKNAFQEHVIQGSSGFHVPLNFHFTIQSNFKEEIVKSVNEVLFNPAVKLTFSEQTDSSNSFVFDEDLKLIYDKNGELITRPSGHGALLTNLDALTAELICIKNIDNVQHSDRMSTSIESWQILLGLLIDFRQRATMLLNDFKRKEWQNLVTDFQLTFDQDSWSDLAEAEIRKLLNRPYRVCGMVKNEGQPGGGPFWIKKNDVVSKQIVEKAQINPVSDQLAILEKSTHFNPVMMVVSPYDLEGNKLALPDFVDNDQFFVVNKSHQGKPIRYMERPGLWNGSMNDWNTVFVEIPSDAFSPVKTITDLLAEAHQPISN